MHHHVQKAGKIGERAAIPNANTMMPICSIEE